MHSHCTLQSLTAVRVCPRVCARLIRPTILTSSESDQAVDTQFQIRHLVLVCSTGLTILLAHGNHAVPNGHPLRDPESVFRLVPVIHTVKLSVASLLMMMPCSQLYNCKFVVTGGLSYAEMQVQKACCVLGHFCA